VRWQSSIPRSVVLPLQPRVMTTNRYIATTHAGSSMFASVFFGLLNPETGELTYINAVCEFRGEADQSDDITMLALKYLP